MRPLRTRLEQARQRTGMGWDVLERDYVLSWILAGISRHEHLSETLVFKGGTALKKCYFGDYYDIWRILKAYQDRLDLTDFERLVRAKCQVRGVDFQGPDDFFDATMLAYVERTWSQWLGNLVPQLPTFERVMGELRPRIVAILKGA